MRRAGACCAAQRLWVNGICPARAFAATAGRRCRRIGVGRWGDASRQAGPRLSSQTSMHSGTVRRLTVRSVLIQGLLCFLWLLSASGRTTWSPFARGCARRGVDSQTACSTSTAGWKQTSAAAFNLWNARAQASFNNECFNGVALALPSNSSPLSASSRHAPWSSPISDNCEALGAKLLPTVGTPVTGTAEDGRYRTVREVMRD